MKKNNNANQAKWFLVLVLVVIAITLPVTKVNAQLRWPGNGYPNGVQPMKQAGYYVTGYFTRVVLVNDGINPNIGIGYGPASAGVGYTYAKPVYRQVKIKVYQNWDGYRYLGQQIPDDQLPPNAYRMN